MSMAEETTDGEVNPLEAVGEAAGAAFMEALADGASPEDAFTAAAAAATQAANDLGISPEISGPVIEAAQTAFEAAIADGATPGEAFETAGDAVADLGAQFFEGGESDGVARWCLAFLNYCANLPLLL